MRPHRDYKGFDESVKAVTGKTLVIGSKLYGNPDRRDLYTDALGLDMQPGDGVDIVHDLEYPLEGQYDHIDCSSVLEHVQRPWLMAANIEVLLKPGGTLLVCAPFVWRTHGYPSDYWRFSLESFHILFPGVEWVAGHYITDDGICDRVSGIKPDGVTHMMRAEAAAFGYRV